MKARLASLIQLVGSFVLLAGLLWLVYASLARLASWLGALQSSIATAIIAAAATVLVSLLSVLVGKHLERRAAIAQENRNKKVPVYEGVVGLLFSIMSATREGNVDDKQPEIMKAWGQSVEQLIVWGSDDVVKAFRAFRQTNINAAEATSPIQLLLPIENLLRAVRRDLGHSNAGLKTGDLLRLFVNDMPSS